MSSYRDPRILAHYTNIKLPGNAYATFREQPQTMVQLGELLRQSVVKLRSEWVEKIRLGQMSGWPNLSPKTIQHRTRRGNSRPAVPLHETGDLTDQMLRWPVEVIYKENPDGTMTISVQYGPNRDQDISCIAKDMFLGNPRVGRDRKTNIPARPLSQTPTQAAKIQDELFGSFKSMFGNEVTRTSNTPIWTR